MSVQNLPPLLVSEILHASSDAIVVTDREGSIVFANEEAEKLFGYAAGEMVGAPVEMLMPQAQRQRHERVRHAYGKSPRARPLLSGLELYGCRKDGTTFRAEIALAPVETGEGLYVASIVREAQMPEETDAYFRALLESAPDAMIIVDRKGAISIVNAQAERMFGYTREELLGNHIEMLLPERFRGRHVDHRREYIGKPEPRPMGRGFELAALRKDGSEFPVEISLSPTRASTGNFVWSVIRDVTERKEMEQEINAARQEAERANKANSAFLAAASHDLRQPVQALNLLNGALRRTVRDERALEMIQSQEHSLTAMTNLLNSLLDISRLDAGAVTPELEEFPVQRLIDRLSAEFSRQARQKGLVFSAGSCGAIVHSDPNLLTEIIQNLVSNAIRYTHEGSVRLECELSDGECHVRVVDTGIGISRDDVDAIFREFHQVRTPGASNEGFGLGLAIVSRLAELLEHEITVSSELGTGSEFGIVVPAVSAVRKARDAAREAETGAVAAPGRILLIEDDPAVTNAWMLLLEAEGHEVYTASSSSEALQRIRDMPGAPDLLISDFHLIDGSTGVETVAAIRDHYGVRIPAFVVSGDTSKIVREARLLENCTLMSKPVDTDRLLRAAGTAIRIGEVPAD